VADKVGVRAGCDALGVAAATFYRQRAPLHGPECRRPSPPRTLPPAERQQVLAILNSSRFEDVAPRAVYATLLEEHTYHCSVRTMYRILAESGPVRERRNQLQRPAYTAPELLATGPNQVWSWDITKLRGPVKWTYYYLYVILDIYSRYVVGWVVATEESSAIAKHLIATCVEREGVNPFELILHADRGPSMTSKPVALLLSDLGVVRSHSRPYVSDDNPFSEAQFKTLKYRPGFPDRFGTVQHARAHCVDFFPWYNCEHRHSGIGLLTPHDVHHGLGAQRTTERATVLRAAFAAHPERFPHGMPVPPVLPSAVWINPPQSGAVSPSLL
jgi:putative transposase